MQMKSHDGLVCANTWDITTVTSSGVDDSYLSREGFKKVYWTDCMLLTLVEKQFLDAG